MAGYVTGQQDGICVYLRLGDGGRNLTAAPDVGGISQIHTHTRK